MEDQLSKNIKIPAGRTFLFMTIFFVLILTISMIIFGQRIWNQQTSLTQAFEECMQDAPFKKSFKAINPEQTLNPDDLQKYFDEFNQIYDKTGLPPIWNGATLIPWRDYHKESIKFAQQCHAKLGITRPQKELRGTYAKPVWDPTSKIWQTEGQS